MSVGAPILSANQIRFVDAEWLAITEPPVVGKDVLELVSTSMYINPLSIYREYIQNSADAIDEARTLGLLTANVAGKVHLEIDHNERSIRLRDNGVGLKHHEFVERLIALGGSKKRGFGARGFRGVGRLAGLGYCQELVFRSRTDGEDKVNELRWDCRRLKTALRSADATANVEDLVRGIVTARRVTGSEYPKRFFEVELTGIVRHRNDVLLNSTIVGNYLSQIAPVPFSPDFRFRGQIQELLIRQVRLGDIAIHLNGSPSPIYRPHRDQFEVRKGIKDALTEIEVIEIPASDGHLAGLGWVLHHGYHGALPSTLGFKGLRLRIGNMQIGDNNAVEELFPEPRFNAWVVGEIHVLDSRILPNGRRDHLEQNVHTQNLLDHLAPYAHALSRRCRTSSARRNWARQFEQNVGTIEQCAAILRQAAVTATKRAQLKEQIEGRIETLERLATRPILGEKLQAKFLQTIAALRATTRRLLKAPDQHKKLMKLEPRERKIAHKFFDLIYEINKNNQAAKTLVERMLRRL